MQRAAVEKRDNASAETNVSIVAKTCGGKPRAPASGWDTAPRRSACGEKSGKSAGRANFRPIGADRGGIPNPLRRKELRRQTRAAADFRAAQAPTNVKAPKALPRKDLRRKNFAIRRKHLTTGVNTV
jgi:hypothetical protein